MAMQDRENPPLGPGPSHIHDAARRAIELYATRLLDAAHKANGRLRESDIRNAITNLTDAHDPDLDAICREIWSACLATAETMHWSNTRRSHFERIMVKCFAQLLPRSDETFDPERHLSRRVIPGFINCLHQILGEDLYTENADRANTLVDTLRAVHGDSFTWDEVYNDPVCQTVVEDVLIGIAHYFSDMAKRRNWMIDVIGAHMPSSGTEAEKAWFFGDGAFHALMNALYGDLRTRLNAPDEQLGLEERHGKARIGELLTLYAGLQRDHADLLQARRI